MKVLRIIPNAITTLWSASEPQDGAPLRTDSEKQHVCPCQIPWKIRPGAHTAYSTIHILQSQQCKSR